MAVVSGLVVLQVSLLGSPRQLPGRERLLKVTEE
jgi:hypothetical protein